MASDAGVFRPKPLTFLYNHIDSSQTINLEEDILSLVIIFGKYRMAFQINDLESTSLSSDLSELSESEAQAVVGGAEFELVLNANVDEWAHNIKRGIATALQLDLAA